MKSGEGRSLSPAMLALVVLGLGVLSILLLLGTDRLRRRSELAAGIRAVALADLQRDVATSHLWLEEYVSGDRVEGAEIFDPLDRSLARVSRWLGEDPRGPAEEDLHPFGEATLLGHAANLKFLLERFEEIAEKRYRGYPQGEAVGIGSALDVEYDRVFRELRSESLLLETALENRRRLEARRSNHTFLLIIVGWGLLVALAAVALWTREKHRRRAEAALGDSQQQLLQAQKMEAVGRLADGVAHDINNYLAAVRGYCELVAMQTTEQPKIGRKMEAAIGTILKASALIDRLLAFSRRQPIEPVVLNLNHLVPSLDKMMGRLLNDDVRLTTELDSKLWNVRADPAQLEQVIVNLLVNARDAMVRGGDLVLATENRHTAAGDEVVLRVRDTGAGIAPAIRDKIFEPFFTTKESTGSSGLGLATAYGVVQRHGGRIEVESEVGRGTVFEVFLPRSLEPVTPSKDRPSDEEPILGAGEYLLLVDDNESFRQATGALLEGLGYRVGLAADGEQALQVAKQTADLDLILTDIVMPGLDGTELLQRLEARPRPVPVIFMSGHSQNELARRGFDPRSTRLLKKPFSAAELSRAVRETLGE